MIRPLLLTTLVTSAATAQIIPTGTPAADILLSQAIAEHRVFLTCSALEPVTHTQITANWRRDIDEAAAVLRRNNVPPDAIRAFTEAASPEALLPAPDTPFEAVKQLCNANPDWVKTYYEFNLTVLELRLPEAFP